MSRKLVLFAILILPFLTLSVSSSMYITYSIDFASKTGMQSVSASLIQVPLNVYHRQPVLIFTNAQGNLQTLRLAVNIEVEVTRNGVTVGGPWSISRKLRLWSCSEGWRVAGIPGLPARSITVGVISPRTWRIESHVSYSLVVDGVVRNQSGYDVLDNSGLFPKSPIVFAAAKDSLEDPSLLGETMGLGPKGWTMGAGQSFDTRVVAMDDEGVDSVTLEYSENNGTWKNVPLIADPLVGNLTDLVNWINSRVDSIKNLFPNVPWPNLLHVFEHMKIYEGAIPCNLGKNVRFHAKASDNDGHLSTSPEGFYYVVDKASPTRVLIVDPFVKLGVLKSNLLSLKNLLSQRRIYQLPTDVGVIRNGTLLARISETLRKHDVFPFHHWELLGKHYNLTMVWPDENLASILRNQSEGGLEPDVIILSNLRFGLNVTGDPGFWNWDLNDIKVNDETMQQVLINYTKQHHAGLIATRGTLSDWVVWPPGPQHYKVGARGHVGSSIEDLDILDEKTIAAMLGMPQLALWEYLRDEVAETFTSIPETKPVGLAVGSLPLQIPFVPLNDSLDATTRGADHPILEGVSLPFNLPVPSIFNEFGFNSYTQIGWQLAMPRHIAYDAWTKSNKTLPLAEETINRFSQLFENVTNRLVSGDNSSRIRDSLVWALERIYRSIISASISGTTLDATFDFHELGLHQPKLIARDIDFTKLLHLLPVQLIACSEHYTAGIVTHDKYWDENGYRSVYFSVEPEACNKTVAETLLKNAVSWVIQWQYQNITTLLGDRVRVPNDLAEAFQNAVDSLPGEMVFSDSIVLVEEGQTTVEINATSSGIIYLLVAHPTCEKVNVTVVSGNGEIQNVTTVAEGLTQVTIQANEEGILEVSITADPDSSLNPAYIAVIPEFPSLIILPIFIMATILAVIVYRKKTDKSQELQDPHKN